MSFDNTFQWQLSRISALTLSLKIPKTLPAKALKIAAVNNLNIIWRPLSRKPPRISAQTLHCQNYSHWATFLPPTIWVYLHLNFHGGCWKTHVSCNRVCNGGSRSSKVVDFGTNRKQVCDFLLVINSNLGPILHHFWDTANYWMKIVNFSYPTLI